jgi:hypothetical protein
LIQNPLRINIVLSFRESIAFRNSLLHQFLVTDKHFAPFLKNHLHLFRAHYIQDSTLPEEGVLKELTGSIAFGHLVRSGIQVFRSVFHESRPFAFRALHRGSRSRSKRLVRSGYPDGFLVGVLRLIGLRGIVFVVSSAGETLNPLYVSPCNGDHAMVEIHAAPGTPSFDIITGTDFAVRHASS